jgi:hypothetical protein
MSVCSGFEIILSGLELNADAFAMRWRDGTGANSKELCGKNKPESDRGKKPKGAIIALDDCEFAQIISLNFRQ